MVPVARKHVYSVCGHSRYTDECPITPGAKTPLLRRFQIKLFRSEIPTRPETLFMMGFCHACRAYYDFAGRSHFDLQTVILRYWAFKNWHGWSKPIAANRIPLDILFGESSCSTEAELEATMNSRLEIEMMFDQIACAPKTPKEETLTRLELVRSATLEWATRTPTPFRPGQSHVLNNNDVTNESETKQAITPGPQVHESTLVALCGNNKRIPRPLDPESFEKIAGAWYRATGQSSLPTPKPTSQQHLQPVSRWSHSTASSVASSVNSEAEEIPLCLETVEILQPVCYQPSSPSVEELEFLKPVCYRPGTTAVKEPELLKPEVYQPERPEGNWI